MKMKYIKLFDSKEESLNVWTKQIIEERFQHAFDLSESYSIELGSFDDGYWYSNYDPEQAYLVELEHNFFDKSSFEEFIKFKKMLDEVEISLEEIKDAYKPSYIGFIENSNTKISIVIKP
jgi:FMN phosphatase YigB (HAD superfamily)